MWLQRVGVVLKSLVRLLPGLPDPVLHLCLGDMVQVWAINDDLQLLKFTQKTFYIIIMITKQQKEATTSS